jgi:hypothetical protein
MYYREKLRKTTRNVSHYSLCEKNCGLTDLEIDLYMKKQCSWSNLKNGKIWSVFKGSSDRNLKRASLATICDTERSVLLLSRVCWYAWRIERVLYRMIGFYSTLVTISLNYNQYSAIADLHNLQFTVAHALGFSVSTSRLLATDLNTETSTSNHYEVSLPFLLQLLCPSLS